MSAGIWGARKVAPGRPTTEYGTWEGCSDTSVGEIMVGGPSHDVPMCGITAHEPPPAVCTAAYGAETDAAYGAEPDDAYGACAGATYGA